MSLIQGVSVLLFTQLDLSDRWQRLHHSYVKKKVQKSLFPLVLALEKPPQWSFSLKKVAPDLQVTIALFQTLHFGPGTQCLQHCKNPPKNAATCPRYGSTSHGQPPAPSALREGRLLGVAEGAVADHHWSLSPRRRAAWFAASQWGRSPQRSSEKQTEKHGKIMENWWRIWWKIEIKWGTACSNEASFVGRFEQHTIRYRKIVGN